MRSTFKQLYYINRSKVKADGTTAIWCRITIDGKQAVLSTGIYCNPDDWNSKKGEVKDIRTNGCLSQYRQHIEDTYNSILKEQGVVSAELLKNTIVAESSLPTTFVGHSGGGCDGTVRQGLQDFPAEEFGMQHGQDEQVPVLAQQAAVPCR